MISLVLFIAKVCGKIVGIFARHQTRLLTKAEFLGWVPDQQQLENLRTRQYQLYTYRMAKSEYKKRKIKV